MSKGVKNVKGPSSKDSSGSSLPLLLDVEDFKVSTEANSKQLGMGNSSRVRMCFGSS